MISSCITIEQKYQLQLEELVREPASQKPEVLTLLFRTASTLIKLFVKVLEFSKKKIQRRKFCEGK
jgi:hypothetical protein